MTGLSYGGDTIPTQTFYNLDKAKRRRIIDAAVAEFSKNGYSNARLSNIIRASDIPRGSLYQYFEDKFDVFKYIFEIIKDKKMEYLKDLLSNPEDKPFLQLFKELFISGTRFALENPKLVKVFTKLISEKGDAYNKIMQDSLQIAREHYVNYIKTDQENGRLRKDIDPGVFADMVIDLTVNISIDEIVEHVENINFEKIYERVTQIINIIEHGVKLGE